MNNSKFKELAQQSFGDDYVHEIARFYGLSARMVRNYKSGDWEPNYAVAYDLLAWNEPGGWKKRMIAKAAREIRISTPTVEDEEEAYSEIINWARGMRDAVWAAKTERKEAEDTLRDQAQLKQHYCDVRQEDRFFEWHQHLQYEVGPDWALTSERGIAVEYAADLWAWSR